jgi:FAD/FMN-containing dehydrogenase
VIRELRTLLGHDAVLEPSAAYEQDATEGRGVRGRADAVVLPGRAADVATALAWCYEHDVPVVPRGGGTGYAGGAVPCDGGVVLGTERLRAVRSLDPLLWRATFEAGLPTGHVHRLARESGLYYPPDPGAAEASHLGGNVATNAGGPHAFLHGVTGHWVTGLEVAVAPGELIHVGGHTRKDVGGYDLRSLFVGSEGTLGIVTAVDLRLIPAPEAALPVVASYPDVAAGCAAVEAVYGSGLRAAALEYLDAATMAAAGQDTGFTVIAEAQGTVEETARLRTALAEALAEGASSLQEPAADALWRWRGGVSIAVTALRGGKVSEDIAVPVDRLREAIERTVEIGAHHGLDACSWGHAGDGNLHSTFLVARDDLPGLERAAAAAGELHALAVELGGTVTGEHGLGLLRSGELARQWGGRALDLHEAVKRAFDPKDLINPGKKRARAC